MIRRILLLSTLFIGLTAATSNAQAFKAGDVMLSPGIGLGIYGAGYGLGFTVPVVFNAEFGVHDYVSVGAYVGFWTNGWRNYRWNSTHVGGRASFHAWQLIDEKVDADLMSDDLDVYVTAWLGYNFRRARFTGDGINSFTIGTWGNRFQGGAQIGVRYFFTENIGVFGEIGGTPTSYSNAGLTFKF